MVHHVTGNAIIIAMHTTNRKSFAIRKVIVTVFAPRTLRMPISLVRFSADNTDNPNKPMHEIKMVRMALNNMICFHFDSAS